MAGDGKIKAEAEVVVNTSGVDDALRKAKSATDKAARESKKATDAQAKEQTKLTAAQEREAKKRSDAERKLLEATARDEKRTQDAQAREYERYQERMTRMHRDEVAKRAQQEIANERKSIATREKLARESLRRIRSFATSVAGGAVAGAVAAGSTARGIAGVQDAGTRVQMANQFRESVALSAGQAGLNQEQTNAAERTAVDVAKKYSVDPMAVAGALDTGQQDFNAFQFTVDHIDEMAKAARATGTDLTSFTSTMLQARQQLGLTDEEFSQAIGVLVAGQDKGAVGAKQFAQSYQELFGVFASALGAKGLDGFKTVVATANTVKTLGKEHGETATMGTRLAQDLAMPETQKGLAKTLKMKQGDVAKLSLEQLVDKLAVNKDWEKAGTRKKIFGDVIPMMAMETLVRQRQKSLAGDTQAVDLHNMMSMTAEDGQRSIDSQFSRVSQLGGFEFGQKAADAFDTTLQSLDETNKSLGKVVDATNWLEEKIGSFAVWVDSLGAAGLGAAATKLLGGSGGAVAGEAATATAAGGAGVLATLGTGVATASAGAVAGAVTIGAATGGGLGTLIDSMVGLALDKKLSTMIGEALPNQRVEDARRAHLAGSGGEVAGQLTRANKHLERIANAQDRKPPAHPGNGNRGNR